VGPRKRGQEISIAIYDAVIVIPAPAIVPVVVPELIASVSEWLRRSKLILKINKRGGKLTKLY
jgi:hypothetical protein